MCCMMTHAMDHQAQPGSMSVAGGHQEAPHDILRRRFALGEISREELEEMEQVLGVAPKGADVSNPRHAQHGGGTE